MTDKTHTTRIEYGIIICLMVIGIVGVLVTLGPAFKNAITTVVPSKTDFIIAACHKRNGDYVNRHDGPPSCLVSHYSEAVSIEELEHD